MGKPVVQFSRTKYKGLTILLIGSQNNTELNEYLKQFHGIRWSNPLCSFYLPYSRAVTNALFHFLREQNYYIDYSALKVESPKEQPVSTCKKVKIDTQKISAAILNVLQEFKKWMIQMRYSNNTIHTYENMLKLFFGFHYSKSLNEIDEKQVLLFNTDYILENGFSCSYQNQAINALKLFYKYYGNTSFLPDKLERPKKAIRLPEVLSIDEVKKLIDNTHNLKHRTLLSLLYSCGLRIGEAVNLRLDNLDIDRAFLHVKSGKGRKDRYVPIPKKMCSLLKIYIKAYQPKKYVFEGHKSGPYSPVSARQVLKISLAKSGITKSCTLHTLRHSHATHLLENGTDIRYIQELLGHNSPKTTMIYTHVSRASLDRIKNPFDEFEL